MNAKKETKKMSYKQYAKTLQDLVNNGILSADKMAETLKKKVEAGELTNPNAGGGGNVYDMPEIIAVKNAIENLLESKELKSKMDAIKLAGYTIRVYTENSAAKAKAKAEKEAKEAKDVKTAKK